MSAFTYHTLTSYDRFRMTPHRLDWENQPRLDKGYPTLDTLELDRHPPIPRINYGKLVHRAGNNVDLPGQPLDMKTVSSLFLLTEKMTAQSIYGNQPFYFRSVASAGALFPCELYIVAHHVNGLAPGVYHYDVFDFCLTVLRKGPVAMVSSPPSGAAATVYLSGIFYRSAWKYRQRAYRYVLLDAGHLLENLRLALSALELSFSVALDFDDRAAAVLLGLEPMREGVLACVHIMDNQKREDGQVAAADLDPLPDGIIGASKVALDETAYTPIETIHNATYSPMAETRDLAGFDLGIGRQPQAWQTLDATSDPQMPDYLTVLRQRRSRRNFVPQPLDEDRWNGVVGLIGAAARECVSPWVSPCLGILVGDNAPVPAGFYLLDPLGERLGRMTAGRFLEPMAMACLDQMWLKNTAFHLLFISDPKALDRQWGARAYRHVMIEAGRLGQQAYLAATAMGLGVCGIGALYDREASDILGLSDNGALLYLVGIGPVQRF